VRRSARALTSPRPKTQRSIRAHSRLSRCRHVSTFDRLSRVVDPSTGRGRLDSGRDIDRLSGGNMGHVRGSSVVASRAFRGPAPVHRCFGRARSVRGCRRRDRALHRCCTYQLVDNTFGLVKRRLGSHSRVRCASKPHHNGHDFTPETRGWDLGDPRDAR